MTTKERETFIRFGFPPEDMRQLDEALKECRMYIGDRRISKKEARAKLGEEQFLSGIGRAAFHMSAMRGDIYFSLSHWWDFS